MRKQFSSLGFQFSVTLSSLSCRFIRLGGQAGVEGYLCCFLFFLPLCSLGQSIKFEKVYGGTNVENGFSCIQTSYDSGYVICGSTSSYGGAVSSMYMIKIDSIGTFKWHQAPGGNNVDIGNCVREMTNRDLVTVGYTNSMGAGGYDMWATRNDSAGNMIWSKTFGGTNWDFGNFLQTTSDGGLIMVGSTYSFGNGGSDIYIVRTNGAGDTIWTRTYGGAQDDEAMEVVQTYDGGFAVCGQSKSYGSGGWDIFLLKVNPSGDTTGGTGWIRIFGGSNDDLGSSLVQTADSGIMVGGTTRSMGAGGSDGIRLKYDSLGNLQSNMTTGQVNEDILNSIVQSNDGGYVYTGKKNFGPGGQMDIWLEKVVPAGWYEWGFSFGGTGQDEGFAIIKTFDGGYLLAGTTDSYGGSLQNMYVIKTDSDGVSSGNVVVLSMEGQNIVSSSSMKIFPNPMQEFCDIYSCGNCTGDPGQIIVTDVLGRRIKARIEDLGPGRSRFFRDNLPAGVYMISFGWDKGSVKLIIQD